MCELFFIFHNFQRRVGVQDHFYINDQINKSNGLHIQNLECTIRMNYESFWTVGDGLP